MDWLAGLLIYLILCLLRKSMILIDIRLNDWTIVKQLAEMNEC